MLSMSYKQKVDGLIMCICLLVVSNFLSGTTPIFAYDWPLAYDNNPDNRGVRIRQHQINAHFGECRGNRDHFHYGIDIDGNAGTRVYAIEGGTAYLDGGGVGLNIGHFRYYHVVNIQVADGNHVDTGTLIGYIQDNHLHLQESDSVLTEGGNSTVTWINPLREGGLSPFVDYTPPVIENVTFWRQGTSEQLSVNDPIWGQIDIQVDAYDPRTDRTGFPAGGACGIYKLTIEFWNGDKMLGDPIQYHTYDNLPESDINLVYANGSSSSNFIYWATNDPFQEPYNKYWNTKQRKGQDYTVDAAIVDEALFADGEIGIKIIAEDIRGNQARYEP